MDRPAVEEEGQEAEGQEALATQEHGVADQMEGESEGPESESHEAPGGHGPGIQTSAETGAQAPGIDAKVDAKEKKKWDKREKSRLASQKKRIVGREKNLFGGARKDWTEKEIGETLKKKGAEGLLVEFNERKGTQAIAIMRAKGTWDALIATLPVGKLKPSTNKALHWLVEDAVVTLDDMMKLFYVRFNHKALDISSGATNAANWNLTTMQTCWRQLDRLPAADITLSSAITTFRAISGGGAFGPSWEDKANVNTIDLGQDNGDAQTLEHTIRHEVGHGVHSELSAQINPWLENDMQFWFTDWDVWINELGGYGKEFVNPNTGAKQAFDGAWKAKMKTLIENWCGTGGWDPAGNRATPDVGEAPDVAAAWAAMPATVQNACAQSTSNWYTNYANFQLKGNKRYFLNHYYHRPFTIGPTAMKAITATNDDYTAMSEKEFFANCYAEYFKNPAGVKHNFLWGGSLPANVKSFFSDVVVKRHPYQKDKAAQKNKPTT